MSNMTSADLFSKVMEYSSDKTEVKEEVPKKPSQRILYYLGKNGYDLNELRPMLETKGNKLVVSCAGSGKTTALILNTIYDIATGDATKLVSIPNGNSYRVPKKIWCCTFLKTGADELELKMSQLNRQLKLADASKSISFSTLHAEFKRVLNSMGVTTRIIDAADNTKLLKKVLKPYRLLNADGRELNSENIRDLEAALAYTRNRLDEKKYDKEIYDELGMGSVIVTNILNDWKKARLAGNYFDFEDLQEALYDACCVKKQQDVIDFVKNRYEYIYVDEFQDTSQIQYAVLKVYAEGAEKIVAIGDDDQTIYSWRGSYNGIITTNFIEDFNPTIVKLSLNFRCPSNILKAIKPSIQRNQGRIPKDLRSSKEGGLVRFGAYANYTEMVNSLSALVEKDIQDGMNVAILCRVNSDGLMPALILDAMNKFNFTISGDGMTLDSYIGRLIFGIVRIFTDNYSSFVKNILSYLTYNSYEVNKLMDVCKANRLSIWRIDEEDLEYSCPTLYPILQSWRMMRRDQGDIVALNLVFDYYRTEVFKKDTQFNMVCRSVILSLQALLAYNKYDDANDFLSDIEYINERLQARRQEYHGNMVRIATVHEFKGKEADSVYIWNDSMDVFPHRDSSGSSEDLQEERRIHYIACTRARKRSTIMSINGSIGLFVQEMDLTDAERIESDYVAQAKGVLKQKSEEQKQMEDNLKVFEEQQLKKINEKLSIKTKEPQKSETATDNFDDFDEVTFEGIV